MPPKGMCFTTQSVSTHLISTASGPGCSRCLQHVEPLGEGSHNIASCCYASVHAKSCWFSECQGRTGFRVETSRETGPSQILWIKTQSLSFQKVSLKLIQHSLCIPLGSESHQISETLFLFLNSLSVSVLWNG